jgi:hypothetical protein
MFVNGSEQNEQPDKLKQPAAILVVHNTGITSILPEFSSICNTRKYWSLPKYEYCRYRKIMGNTGYTSIADTGRLATKLRNVLVYWFFFPVCASVMRGRTVYRETGRKETRGGRKEKRREEGREKGEARWEK